MLEYFGKDPECLLFECAGDCDIDDDCGESFELFESFAIVMDTYATYESLINSHTTNTNSITPGLR